MILISVVIYSFAVFITQILKRQSTIYTSRQLFIVAHDILSLFINIQNTDQPFKMLSTELNSPLNTHAADVEEPNWFEERPPPYNSTSSYLTGPDKFENLHLDDPKDTNDEDCNKTAQVSTRWTHTSEVTISPPSQAYFPDMKSQTGITPPPFSESQRTQEQPPPISKPPQIPQTRIEESTSQPNIEAPQSSTWWSTRWSTTWAQAFGETTTTPNQIHIPSQKAPNKTLSRTANPNPIHTGRNPHQGFQQTQTLLANHLMHRRRTCTNSRPQEPSPELRKTYEQAARTFIDLIQTLILQSEGPNQRVDDWTILGMLDAQYAIAIAGEKKPYLYGEWEYLWAVHEDEIAMRGDDSGAEKSARDAGVRRMEYRVPTREDWKWWCGEWKKVPGAMREWKAREEIWPWQRRFWVGVC